MLGCEAVGGGDDDEVGAEADEAAEGVVGLL